MRGSFSTLESVGSMVDDKVDIGASWVYALPAQCDTHMSCT